MLVDTHCHLDFSAFSARLEQVMADAARCGVTQIVVPSVTVDNFSAVMALCSAAHPPLSLYPALGLHPCFMAQHQSNALIALEQMLERYQHQVVALGEIGLDGQIAEADLAAQLLLFKGQLALAKRFDLPVLLHVRKAHDQVLKQLRQFKLQRGGIVHAFSGSEQQAQEYIKLGFKLGFGGAISYERATKLRGLAARLPLESIVLETDAPDMPLAAFRGEANEPQRVAVIAELVAQLRGVTLAEVAAVTTHNAQQLLGLKRQN